ncbi:MAG: LysM peptidoglycan-binding domain-containing protein [Anaerolineales bacterium]
MSSAINDPVLFSRHNQSVAQASLPDKRGYNAHMKKEGKFLNWMIISLLSTAGCASEISLPSPTTQQISAPQTPYQVITITPSITSTPFIIPTEQPILPSPTPFKHAIQPGDTLYGIAFKYNISLDKLVSANPGIDTSILTIGNELNIPFNGDEGLSVPTPTPYPVSIGDPTCRLTNDGGMWCFSIIHNNQNHSLENISAAINLYDGEHILVQSYVAIPPLDYLFPDQKIPAAVYISPPLPDEYQVSAVLITSLLSERESNLTKIAGPVIKYSSGKKIASITGTVNLPEALSPENKVWVAAVAYSDEEVIGIRKWVSSEELQAGGRITFDLILYSLGPPIDEVQLFSELH